MTGCCLSMRTSSGCIRASVQWARRIMEKIDRCPVGLARPLRSLFQLGQNGVQWDVLQIFERVL
jgi:hypothetical protein